MKNNSLIIFASKGAAQEFCDAMGGFFSVTECPISPAGLYVFIADHDAATIAEAVKIGCEHLTYGELKHVMRWDVCKAEAKAKLAAGRTVPEAVAAGYTKMREIQ